MTSIHPENLNVLENSLALAIGEDFSLENDPDVIQQLIGDKRSLNTKREYQKDLKDFFLFVVKKEPSRDLVLEFLHLEQRHAVAVVLKYKAHLIKKKLAEATVNRRLSATQRFSRHAQVQTVLKYDDNRQRLQKQMSDSISELI